MEAVKATKSYLSNHRELLKNSSPTRGVNWAEQIERFLGGVITHHSVKDALSMLNAIDQETVDAVAVKTITQPTKAAEFAAAVRGSAKKIHAQDWL